MSTPKPPATTVENSPRSHEHGRRFEGAVVITARSTSTDTAATAKVAAPSGLSRSKIRGDHDHRGQPDVDRVSTLVRRP